MEIHIYCFHMGNRNIQIYISKQGFRHLHFQTGMDQSLTHTIILSVTIWGLTEKANINPQMGMVSIWGSPFLYGDPHMETGRQTNKIPYPCPFGVTHIFFIELLAQFLIEYLTFFFFQCTYFLTLLM